MTRLMLNRAGQVVWCTWLRRKHDMQVTSDEPGLTWLQCSRRGCNVYDFIVQPLFAPNHYPDPLPHEWVP